jgi:ATP-dependent Clp protease ATP-binding subunit ClpB
MYSIKQYFNQASQNILIQAKKIAISKSHEQLQPTHLALALFGSKDADLLNLFRQLEIKLDLLESDFQKYLAQLPKKNIIKKIIYARATEQLLQRALQRIRALQKDLAQPLDLLVALCGIEEPFQLGLLKKGGLEMPIILQVLEGQRISFEKKEKPAASQEKEATPKGSNITEFCSDLVEKAKQDKIDPIIGRDEELRGLIQVILRRRKNNPLLIGEPGVGKTAIVEALAHRIANGDVPEKFQRIQLLELDLGKLVAGTRYRGDFEKRIKGVIQEITQIKEGAILFIDEVHMLTGAGATQGSLDASNMFKPALARGELHCIGATTLKEYKKYIESNAALARRFQPILIEEPDIQSCIGILRGLKEKYEVHHGVRIQDAAILAASELSDRYINDRFLPDKAIDLIDEAASKIRMETESMPVEIDLLARKILQLKIEKTALLKEEDKESKKRNVEIEKNILEASEKIEALKKRWEEEKETLAQGRNLKAEIEKKKKEELEAQRTGNLELAAKLRYGDLANLTNELEKNNQKMDSYGYQRFIREEVSKEEVCNVIAKWTGIPLEKMMLSEREKLLKLEQHLEKRVVGQENAINAVANSVRRARTYVDDLQKPSGSFFFFGPTGVGKTELVKALADILFNDEQSIIRLDMSEYMEKHTISRLIGAPPGYVGYEEGGLLTEAVRRNPYSIVLLDEIEKGHSDIFNILLQILDEGILTDSKGTKVSFKNTIIVLTSNFGSEFFFQNKTLTPILTREILLRKFKPELLNRLDEIIPFYPLQKENILKIINIYFHKVKKSLAAQNIEIGITVDALKYLVDIGYDREFGARPLRRIVQKELLDIIAYKIIDKTIEENDKIEVRYSGEDNLTIHRIR